MELVCTVLQCCMQYDLICHYWYYLQSVQWYRLVAEYYEFVRFCTLTYFSIFDFRLQLLSSVC